VLVDRRWTCSGANDNGDLNLNAPGATPHGGGGSVGSFDGRFGFGHASGPLFMIVPILEQSSWGGQSSGVSAD
jgi:hypothetical protein